MSRKNAFLSASSRVALVLVSIPAALTQGDPDSNSPVYILPPGGATSSSFSSFDYWWPFPPTPTPTSTPSSSVADRSSSLSTASLNPYSQSSIAVFPTITFSTNALAPFMSNSSTTSTSSIASSPSSTSDSIIRITASNSPEPQTSHHSPVFKFVYLTPLFAVLGLVSGATLGGMLFRWYARRKFNQSGVAYDDQDERDGFTQADVLVYPQSHPRSRTTRLELGEGYGHLADKEIEDRSDESNLGNNYDVLPNKRSPYAAHSAALLNASPSRASPPSQYDTPPHSSHHNTTQPNNITRPWYDRLPGLAAQIDITAPLRSPPSTNKEITPASFALTSLSPDSDNLAERDIRTHSSIRRAIAERLRVGSRRVGSKKEGGRDLLDVQSDVDNETEVRRASGNQIRDFSSEGLQHRGQRGPISMVEPRSRYRKDVDGFKDSETLPLRLTPDENAPMTIDGFEGGPEDHASPVMTHIDLTRNPERATSASSTLLPESQRYESSSKLRPKARLLSSNEDAQPLLASSNSKRKVRPRSSFSPTGGASEEAPNTIRLLNPPRRVISPPAHPELFFADPVLGEYIENDSSQSPTRVRAKKPAKTGDAGAQRKLHSLKPPAEVHSSSQSTASDDIRSGAESSSASMASAFQGRPMKPGRAREMAGAVDAIMKTGWTTREGTKLAEQEEHTSRKTQQLREAGLGERPR